MRRALRATSRMSHAIARLSPAPAATPLIPPTAGLSHTWRRPSGERPTHEVSVREAVWPDSGVASSPVPPRSRPLQNASPEPVMATTQTSSSRAACSTASTTPHASSLDRAFFFSGRWSRIVRTRPASLISRTLAMTGQYRSCVLADRLDEDAADVFERAASAATERWGEGAVDDVVLLRGLLEAVDD